MTETIIGKYALAKRLTQSVAQSILSLSFNVGGMLAGTLLALYFDVFSLAPWVLAIYPGILSMRGVIGGLFSGRLSTGLHVGSVRAGFTGNTRTFYLLWRAIIVLTLESSIMLGLIASLFGTILWGTTPVEAIAILGIITATMAISIVFISPITIAISILSFKHGLDPDIITYPIESTVADMVITACYILTLNMFFLYPKLAGYVSIGLLNVVLLCLALYFLFKNAREKEFFKTLRESFLTLALVALIVNTTGSFLIRIAKAIGTRMEIYGVYPAMIDTIGDVGSIVGSTATTKLALGTIRPSFSAIKQHSMEIWGGWMASLFMFAVYFIISTLIHSIYALDELLRFAAAIYITNLLAASCMTVIAYTVAIYTYQRGWDPDNFVIPIESSLADTITTIFLLVALIVVG